ncbi:MAG: acylneuraminate cytidylyltransferase [Candidatus Aminicenantes bacterium]|nr:acylneuraminate cytidylyltransferase [Candidatus Aminicenantes bacterium]
MAGRAEVLAVVPARGGSKGIPGKNIKPFCGRPLIAYSIAAGLEAKTVSRVVLDTDDERIAEAGRAWGAETPFLRPPELARDETPDWPVFRHLLDRLARDEGYRPEAVVHLRPTSPIRPRGCVDEAVARLFREPEADCVRSVMASEQNPYKMWRLEADGSLVPLLSVEGMREPYNAPRQALPATYWQSGHVDAVRPSVILKKESMTGSRIVPLVVESRFASDLDDLHQWRLAESRCRDLGGEIVTPGRIPRPFPDAVRLLVLDFDGVLTDNRVWVDGDGREAVAAYRGDGMGVIRLRRAGVGTLVLSAEVNPVVAARCRKVGMECLQGVEDKAAVLKSLLREKKLEPAGVVFVGNDINDLPCFGIAGFAAAPADAEPAVLREADLVLARCGGRGAVRELCDLILERMAAS